MYELAIGRAIRAGLGDHPSVQEWLSARRSLGDWAELRRLRLGFEKGVKRSMSKADFWVTFHAHDLIEEHEKKQCIDAEAIGKRPGPMHMGLKSLRRALVNRLGSQEPAPYFDLSKAEIERLGYRLKSTTHQNFHKWVRRLGIDKLSTRNVRGPRGGGRIG